MDIPSRKPPMRKPGQGKGPRTLSGEVMDVHTAATEFFGGSEDFVRSRAARGELPYRRWGRKIIFLRSEIQAFLIDTLPGVTLAEARENVKRRIE